MRDHLLGCAQFIPDVENERVMPLAKAKPFALGVPTRVYAEEYARARKAQAPAEAIEEFHDHDHTPAGMMADFPREYDLTTMLNEAAGRRDFVAGGRGKSLYDLMQEYDDLMQEYDEQVQRQCGMVLNANKSTNKTATEVMLQQRHPVHVGVDLAVPGGDMSAVAMRRGPETDYPIPWQALYRAP